MTATISVKVEGPVGLDEPEQLLEELGRETGLTWRLETAGQDGTLDGGLAAIMLEAVLGGTVGAAVQVAVQQAIENWRGRRLDPPPVTIIVVQPPQAPPAAQDPQPAPRTDGLTSPEGS